jgi:hypothetical protein
MQPALGSARLAVYHDQEGAVLGWAGARTFPGEGAQRIKAPPTPPVCLPPVDVAFRVLDEEACGVKRTPYVPMQTAILV